MRRSRRMAACATLATGLAASSLVLQSQATLGAEERLKAAELKELEDGCGAAIRDYQALADSGRGASMAQALFRLAECYRKMGRAEAAGVYERLVAQYPDQTTLVARARPLLDATRSAQQGPTIMPRRLDVNPGTTVSRDGLYGASAAQGALEVRDLISGRVLRTIAAPPQIPGEGFRGASAPQLSFDGRRVAYTWTEGVPAQLSIRVTEVASGATTTVAIPSLGGTSPSLFGSAGWLPDGRSLLAMSMTATSGNAGEFRLDLVDTARGAAQTVLSRALSGAASIPNGFTVSPDGRHVAFQMGPAARGQANDQHIYVLGLLDGTLTDVVAQAGNNRSPLWTPDGRRLVFVSDRTGTPTLWSIGVANGAAAGSATPVTPSLAGVQGLLQLTTHGALLYRTVSGGDFRVVVAERNPGGPSGAPPAVVAEFPGLSATWSPDGQSIAFLDPVRRRVIVRSAATGGERTYDPPSGGNSSVSPRWFHDGTALLLPGPAGGGAGGTSFFKLDLASGSWTKLFDGNTPERQRGGVVALSPDDSTIYLTGAPGRPQPGGSPQVLAVDLATGTERTIATFPSGQGVALNAVSLSPDGSTLLLAREVAGAGRPNVVTLWLLGTDGQGLRALTGPVEAKNGCADKCVFTPDGRHVVFSQAQADGTWRVMRVPVEGGEPTPDGLDFAAAKLGAPSLQSSGPAFSLAVSPDGSRIMFGHGTTASIETWALDSITLALPQ